MPKAVSYLKAEAPLVVWTNFLGKQPILSVAKQCGYSHILGEYLWVKPTSANHNKQMKEDKRDGEDGKYVVKSNEDLLRVSRVTQKETIDLSLLSCLSFFFPSFSFFDR